MAEYSSAVLAGARMIEEVQDSVVQVRRPFWRRSRGGRITVMEVRLAQSERAA
jgi:hypothetical protein